MEQAVNNVQKTNKLQRVIADAVTEEICNKRSKQSRGRMNKQIMDAHYNSINTNTENHRRRSVCSSGCVRQHQLILEYLGKIMH